uniref:Uncharacterized protein n=1 Tax=viral metagenome TaxID=1070528 RepID=A0A6C0JQV7_9ZZZZ
MTPVFAIFVCLCIGFLWGGLIVSAGMVAKALAPDYEGVVYLAMALTTIFLFATNTDVGGMIDDSTFT